ncbi:pilus assembly protein Flp/PilA [Sphingomonas sp. PvP056]|jgi:pilus assembly protein Flp/PilA
MAGGIADMIVGIIKRLFADRTGGTAIEYGLIVALVVIATVAAIVQLANVTTGMWNRVSTAVITSS